MIEISEQALMMAVQALSQVISDENAAREQVEDDLERADYDEVIYTYELAAAELRKVYETALGDGADLPPYRQLVPAPGHEGDAQD